MSVSSCSGFVFVEGSRRGVAAPKLAMELEGDEPASFCLGSFFSLTVSLFGGRGGLWKTFVVRVPAEAGSLLSGDDWVSGEDTGSFASWGNTTSNPCR